LKKAIEKAIELGAGSVGIETDQGGDTWRTVYDAACNAIKQKTGQRHFPIFKSDKAGAGYGPKGQRNQKMMVIMIGEMSFMPSVPTCLSSGRTPFPCQATGSCRC